MKITKDTKTGQYCVTDDQERVWYVYKAQVRHSIKHTMINRWLITDHDGKSVKGRIWTRQFSTRKECLDWIRAQH